MATNGEFKIEKGVPHKAKGGAYPFAEMKVGDSFLIPTDNPRMTQAAIGTAAARFRGTSADTITRKFATSQVEGGVRIWRTA